MAKNWTQEQRRKCVSAANAVLKEGGSEENAIYACINAAGKSKRGKAMKNEPLEVMVPVSGPESADIVFIGASPTKIEAIRGRALCGPAGETFRDCYLKALSADRDDVAMMHLVPTLLTNDKGKARDPNVEEIQKYAPWVYSELIKREPKIVVALGKVARDALGDIADTWLPHPTAVRMFGDSGEVERKLWRVRKMLSESSDIEPINGRRRTALLRSILKAVDDVAEAEMEKVFRMPILNPDNGGSSWVEWSYSGPSKTTYSDTTPDGDTFTSIVERDGQIYLTGSIARSAVMKSGDEELRLVTGVVMEPDEFDSHGDITSSQEIQQAAYAYLYNSQVLGDQHSKPAPSDVKIVESYIAPSDLTIGEQSVKKGSWVITAHVVDDTMWEAIKSGEYTGFSIGGFAQKV